MSDRRRITFEVPAELVEQIAARAAEIAVERLRAEPESEFLTVAEAAALIGATPQRIYDLRSDGRLTRHGDGGRALVARAELVDLVRKGR
jgi:excisionase family DNA binding protein